MELAEWMAYEELEPFGEARADMRAGIIAATFANVHRRKGARPFKPIDFMPKFDRQPEQTPEQQLRIVEALNKAFGGKDVRGQRGNDRDA